MSFDIAQLQKAAVGVTYKNITTKTTTTLKTGYGILRGITINTPGTTDTLTIYDNVAASGTKIGTLTVPSSGAVHFPYNVEFLTGLTIVSGGGTAGDYTIEFA